MNISTSPTSSLLPSSPPTVLSTTTADTNELMKKIDYFIKVNKILLSNLIIAFFLLVLCSISNRCISSN